MAPRRWLTILTLAALSACGPEPAEVALTVSLGDGVGQPAALQVFAHRKDDPTPQIFGPVRIADLGDLDVFVQVDFGEQFFLEAWGCRSSVEECRAEDRLSRGCSSIASIDESERAQISVVLLDDAEGSAACDAIQFQ
jgi:hypothetical protein